jgi:hypothetical protein
VLVRDLGTTRGNNQQFSARRTFDFFTAQLCLDLELFVASVADSTH